MCLLHYSLCTGRISEAILYSGSGRRIPNVLLFLLSLVASLGAASGTEGIVVNSIGSGKKGLQPNKSEGEKQMYSTGLYGHNEYHEKEHQKTTTREGLQLQGRRTLGNNNIFDHASDSPYLMDEKDNTFVHPSEHRTKNIGAGRDGGYKNPRPPPSGLRPSGRRPKPQQPRTHRPNRPQKIPKFCTRCKKKFCSERKKVKLCGTTIGGLQIGCFPKRCKAQRKCSKKCKYFLEPPD